eukprot:15441651-Alexandrium_andersonii.AAC.1
MLPLLALRAPRLLPRTRATLGPSPGPIGRGRRRRGAARTPPWGARQRAHWRGRHDGGPGSAQGECATPGSLSSGDTA